MSQPPRVRRDPRDPASMRVRVPPPTPGQAQNPSTIRIEDPACFILAVPDLDAGRLSRDDRDLLGAARQLADAMGGAVVLLACMAPSATFRVRAEQEGADRVVLLRDVRYADEMAEPRVAGVLAAAEACPARHILFSDSFIGGELARRVAARLGDRPAFNVRRLSSDGLLAEIDAGALEVNRSLPRVIVTARATFNPPDPAPLREARPVDVPVIVTDPRVSNRGALPLDPAAVPLGEADLIISAGSGLTDWASFHQAAKALAAAEAGSRVVCDAGLLPRSRQVGASGLLVEPRCYLAFGIAGASQHLQGIAGAERVVAVNTDLRAEMVKRADLAIVADAQAVLPALVRRAAARRPTADPEAPAQGAPASDHRPLCGTPPRPPAVVDQGTSPPRVLALVSLGRHPVSKRPRRADLDGRALELALGCTSTVTAVHAGPADTDASALRDYLGAGAAALVRLDCSDGSDPLPALESYIRTYAPDLVVTGTRAEAGECSGMTPFWLAERLRYGLATGIVGVELCDGKAILVQAMPGGRRRKLEAPLPLVIAVDRTGPDPRLSARMRALRGTIAAQACDAIAADVRTGWSTKPSRPRPKRLMAPKASGQGAGSETDQRRELLDPDPDAAAEAILDFLDRNGLLTPQMPQGVEKM